MFWFSLFSSTFSKTSEVRLFESVGPASPEVRVVCGESARPVQCPWQAGNELA